MTDKMIVDELNDLCQSGRLTLGEIMTLRDAKPRKQKTIDDWLRADHQRNDMQRDVERLKQDMHQLQLTLFIAVILIVLMLSVLLLLWFSG